MKSIKRYLIAASIIASVWPGSVEARQLTLEEAMDLAPVEVVGPRSRASESLVYVEKYDQMNVAYVVDRNGVDNGYVVLAADDLLPVVLGYADNGRFDCDNMPPAMKEWLNGYGRLLEYAVTYGASPANVSVLEGVPSIAPLCKTRWNQSAPYNNMCPEINGTIAPTGCTATAMAQVVRAHRWPARGTGSHTYTLSSLNENLTFDFGGTTFDWGNMLDYYSQGNYTSTQGNAVATLMLACGNAACMSYGETASGAYIYDALYGLVNYMNYDKSAWEAKRDYFSSGQWNQMVYDELKDGRPVLYSGANNEAGHAFVVDGYDKNGFFHLNWGWGGLSDGYFMLTALDPDSQGIGGSTGAFNFSQNAVIGLKPQSGSSDYTVAIYGNGDLGVGSTNYKRTEEVLINIDGYFDHFALADRDIILGVKLQSTTGDDETIFVPGDDYTVNPHYDNIRYWIFTGYTVPASEFPNSGTYIVTPAYSYEGEVYDIRMRVGYVSRLNVESRGSLGLKFTPDVVKHELVAGEPVFDSPLYTGKPCTFTVQISNTGHEYLGEVYPVMLDATGKQVSELDAVRINVLDGESIDVTFSGTFLNGNMPLSPADYFINIIDEFGNVLNPSPVNVKVLAIPTGELLYVAAFQSSGAYSGDGSYNNPYIVADKIEFETSVYVSSGFFNDILYAFVVNESNFTGSTSAVGDNSVVWHEFMVGADNQQTKKYAIDLEPLTIGDVYSVRLYGFDSSFNSSLGWIDRMVNTLFFKKISSGVDEITADGAKGRVYPMPADTRVTLEATADVSRVDIYSMSGMLMQSVDVSGSGSCLQLDVEALPAGHYVMSVTTVNGIETYRLMKR